MPEQRYRADLRQTILLEFVNGDISAQNPWKRSCAASDKIWRSLQTPTALVVCRCSNQQHNQHSNECRKLSDRHIESHVQRKFNRLFLGVLRTSVVCFPCSKIVSENIVFEAACQNNHPRNLAKEQNDPTDSARDNPSRVQQNLGWNAAIWRSSKHDSLWKRLCKRG